MTERSHGGDRHRGSGARSGRTKSTDARGGRTLAASIRRNEWERVALLLLIALTEASRALPAGDVDDVLALLAGEAALDDR
jgi:hypothetical protein